MSALIRLFLHILRRQRRSLLRGALLSAIVLLMGAALLGLSGWFITAAAAAGLAGTGAFFDVFRPSALVRFLALGRTAARYGERLLTHDATLRALADLRVTLLTALAAAPYDRLIRTRGAQALNRITADVDALDGLPLRLVLPIAAGLAAHAVAFAALWHLVDLSVAAAVTGITLGGAALSLTFGGGAAIAPSRRAETAAQAFRTRLIDLIAARSDLTLYGQLPAQTESTLQAEATRQAELTTLDRLERRAGLALSLTSTLAAGAALSIGGTLAGSGAISPARAAIGVFVALALSETIAPIRRAMADLGRMTQAARRVSHLLPKPARAPAPRAHPTPGALTFARVAFFRDTAARPVLENLDLTVRPGEWVALTGPSGAGKSTVLLLAARLLAPSAGQISLGGILLPDWPADHFRQTVTLVPQRAALLQGSIADNLRLAAPDAEDGELWNALDATALATVIDRKGGLNACLGPRGAGLSGGEARRLVLARALLRRPRLLLLDEPTEGLDSTTAKTVLQGLRQSIPGAAVLLAAHRNEETAFADRTQAIAKA